MKLSPESMTLYAITDSSWLKNDTLANQVELVLQGGATFLQLREKELDNASFLALANEILPIARRYHVPCVINDNIEVALQSGADGVHVGQKDIQNKDVRALIGPDKILGISANTVQSAIQAEQSGADYIGVGAVFSTSTKKDAGHLSMQTLKEICQSVHIPVVAIGGINEQNVMQLCGSGVNGIAVISAIFASPDVQKATRNLLALSRQMLKGGVK